jgi:hypothetical protein
MDGKKLVGLLRFSDVYKEIGAESKRPAVSDTERSQRNFRKTRNHL